MSFMTCSLRTRDDANFERAVNPFCLQSSRRLLECSLAQWIRISPFFVVRGEC